MFNRAVLEYRKICPQADDFLKSTAPSECQDLLRATKKQSSKSISKRAEKLTSGIFGYSKIVDVVAQGDPALTAMVWGSLRLLLQVEA